jgi:hypothetical protein
LDGVIKSCTCTSRMQRGKRAYYYHCGNFGRIKCFTLAFLFALLPRTMS